MKIIVLIAALILAISGFAFASEDILFDFEGSNEGWAIPDWAYYQGDHVAREVKVSSEKASSGKDSLEVVCEFPGDAWAAALVEHREDMDWSGYESISVDIYLPKKAPKAPLQARIVLTIGIGWHFIEMRYAVPLKRGRWTKIKAKLESEEPEESDWKGRREKQLFKHIKNIRKVAVRIEYDASPPYRIGRKYHGPIYIDNMVIK